MTSIRTASRPSSLSPALSRSRTGRTSGCASFWSWVSFGVRLDVRLDADIPREDVLQSLPPGRKVSPHGASHVTYSLVGTAPGKPAAQEEGYELYRGTDCIYRTDNAHLVLSALQNDAEWQVAVRADGHLFVHAGAVAWLGQGIMLPGCSGAGKSTLVASLLRSGCAYFSDEYAAIDRSGDLRPFPCLMTLKDRPPHARRVGPETFGGAIGQSAAPIALVAFPTYDREATFQVEQLPPSEGVLRLLTHVPVARVRPTLALTTAAIIAQSARFLALRYDESTRAAQHLIEGLEEEQAARRGEDQ